jgi:hypothetical protein
MTKSLLTGMAVCVALATARTAMGTINVVIDAQVGGEEIKFSFNWEGDRQEIERSMDLVRKTAKLGDVTPQQFAHSTLIHLPKTRIMLEEGAQQVQLAAILFAVLTEAEKRIEEVPGSILDVTADQDITAIVQVRDAAITMSISGAPGKDSAYAAMN